MHKAYSVATLLILSWVPYSWQVSVELNVLPLMMDLKKKNKQKIFIIDETLSYQQENIFFF